MADIEQKLKALKVADLKAILTKADAQAPAKATKADLVARILASPAAQDAYKSIHEPETAQEPAEETEDAVAEVEAEEEQEPVAEAATEPEQAPKAAEPVDPELEKRRQRAARFGIPLVEPKAPKPKPEPKAAKSKAPPPEDKEKLNARAARFGVQEKAAAPESRKRSAPVEAQVDAEEAERRRKRAERFGMST